jgi:hypothetical protein
VRISIERTWDGAAADPGEHVGLDVLRSSDELRVAIDAPYHGDPPPPAPEGHCDGLWEYEAVELFLLGAHERYLEIELGPHGHFLVLSLAGRRQRERVHAPRIYRCRRAGSRWRGEARIALADLPADLHAWNAYALHGSGAGRRYLAYCPVPGDRPDFHRLECFAPVPDALRSFS